ncbi:MAG TPA: hypothetical protein VN201_01555 [Roseateles sp.]|nr:hypothetical protein [Roseateles sp.]
MAAAELIDFRGRISQLADAAIDAKAKSTGRERQEIVREILDAWADREVHGASLLLEALQSKGLSGSASGARGQAEKG